MTLAFKNQLYLSRHARLGWLLDARVQPALACLVYAAANAGIHCPDDCSDASYSRAFCSSQRTTWALTVRSSFAAMRSIRSCKSFGILNDRFTVSSITTSCV